MSYLLLESYQVRLASPEYCMVWTAEAQTAFDSGATPWREVLKGPQMALQNFHHRVGADATLYVACHPFTDNDGRSGSLVSLYFATDAITDREVMGAIEAPLKGANSGWEHDGVHPAPENAFPCLATRHGEIHQIWQGSHDEDPEVRVVTARGLHLRVQDYRFGNVEARWLPAGVKHALGQWGPTNGQEHHMREQLKMAFAYRIAERVVEADGVVGDNELEFMKRSFPKEQLALYWLDDPEMRVAMARQAEEELSEKLGYHEKLGLLSTFYGACFADGSIQVQELRVLKDACAALGLENREVVMYLQRFW